MLRRDFLRTSLAGLGAATILPVSHAMGASDTRRIIYVYGQFGETTPKSIQETVEKLGGSGFNVVILSFLQAAMAGGKLNLTYNGNAFSSFSQEGRGLLARLRSGFSTRRRVMVSIGGWMHEPTFAAIRSAGVPAFVRQLTEEAVRPLGLDGIDLDLEPQTGGLDQWFAVHREYGKILVDLTNEYKRVHPTHVVTHAPTSAVAAEFYAKPTTIPGAPGGLLQGTRSARGNNIDWLNVQFYEGGAVEGGDIVGFYRDSLAEPLTRIAGQAGVPRALPFLVPLFEPQAKQPLAFCRRTIQAADARCADLHSGRVNGIALWDYRQVAPSIGDWSRGLENALGA